MIGSLALVPRCGSGGDSVRESRQSQVGQDHHYERADGSRRPCSPAGRRPGTRGRWRSRRRRRGRTRSWRSRGRAAGGRRRRPRSRHRQPPIIPAHCRVQLVLKPTSDSLINMELWLPPADKWNGKFMGVGNGGFAGSIQGLANDMPQALRLGYATAGTDTGHQEQGGEWAIGHPEKMIDFGYRATHEMTLRPSRSSRPSTIRARSTPTSRDARPAAAWR